MADTNTYDLFQKVEKWTTKEKFNAIDPRTIETGTEYNLSGPIDETDLASDLLAKINEVSNKLTKPTNPSAESAVTMLADGTVGTKLLSEIGGGGGGKLYLHNIKLVNNTIKTSPPPEKTVYEIYITLLDRNVNEINTADKLIERFDNYIYRNVIVHGRYSSGEFYGESYNTSINDFENTSKIVVLNGASIVNSMPDLTTLGIRIDGNRQGWILKTFSGSTYTADNITYTDAVTEV